ncbi:MAG TPA: PIN domain-containing protein [Microthrixaceae bacterium]|nr:PIN domain-containing protein [Microthrixaceae bacterium]
MLIVDTGPLVAAADRSDPHHDQFREVIEADPGPFVTTAMVVAEAAYLLDRQLGADAEIALYDMILEGSLRVEPLMADDWTRVRELVDQYRDLPLGGTDAGVVAIAERLKVSRLATVDRTHFTVVRPKHVEAFALLAPPV